MGQQPQQMFRPPITTPPPFHQQGQPMMQQQQQQQQPAVKTPQEKQAQLEKFLTYLDNATPEQQEQLFMKIRATPEHRQQLLARVQAMRIQRQLQAQGTMQQGITIWNGYMEMVEMVTD
jgi:Trp operon repressor